MSWTFEFSKQAEKQFKKLDAVIQLRIKKAVLERLIVNPKLALIPLTGDRSRFYKFRVGDYRLLCSRDDQKLYVLLVKIKHRKEAYRR